METGGPRLGIFWIDGQEIISYSVPLDRAEQAGGYANYPHGHAQLWPLVLRSRPWLSGNGYEAIPRGRITYHVAAAVFHLLVPTMFATNNAMITKLVRRFGLSPAQVRVLGDEHYDPPT